MSTLFVKTAQVGEWFEIGAKLTDPTVSPATPIDVTGKTVTLTVRTGAKSTDQAVAVDGATTAIEDGPGGIVSAGGRISTAATYWGTISVGVSADGPGWPVKEQFQLKITDCP